MSNLFHRLYQNRARHHLNKEVATRNLFDFADLLAQYDVPYILAFGTLLGAVRDGDFITHDCDVDLASFSEYLPAVQSLCRSKLFSAYGFRVVREGSQIVSVDRDREYIDLYLFSAGDPDYRCNQYRIEAWQLKSGYGRINFLGRDFNTVKDPEADLRWRYGTDWQTPRRGFHAPF